MCGIPEESSRVNSSRSYCAIHSHVHVIDDTLASKVSQSVSRRDDDLRRNRLTCTIVYWAVQPPSTSRQVPVTSLAASEAK